MKYILISILMLSGLLMPARATQQDQQTLPPPPLEEETIEVLPGVEALERVKDYMRTTTSLQADFAQRTEDGTISTGQLYMQRPGKIRFDYADDIPFLVVSNGTTLNFIDYEIGQVTKWPVADTPLRALLDRELDLVGLGASINVIDAGGKDVIALSAVDQRNPDSGAITLFFADNVDTGVLDLISWTVKDAKGALTYVELSNQHKNPALSDDLWQFEDPRGSARRRRAR